MKDSKGALTFRGRPLFVESLWGKTAVYCHKRSLTYTLVIKAKATAGLALGFVLCKGTKLYLTGVVKIQELQIARRQTLTLRAPKNKGSLIIAHSASTLIMTWVV